MYVLERDSQLASAPSPGTNLGADTQGPGAKGQTAPGVADPPWALTPLLLILLLISFSHLMVHIACMVTFKGESFAL